MDIRDTQEQVELNNTQIAIDYGNPAGTSRELNGHLPGIAEKYEVKLERESNYKARPDATGGQINVSTVNPDSDNKYKGFKHAISSGNVNRITIYGHITDGIDQDDLEGVTFQNNGGVFVYFPLDGSNPELKKPLLICLSERGDANGNNKWYERQSGTTPGTYTWNTATGLDSKNPTDISGLENNLGKIKGALNPDTGYPNPADGNDTLNDQEGNASGIEIKINQTNDYQSGASNSETVKVFLKNNNPKFGYTCYTHKVQGAAGKYKKMTSASLKKGSDALTKPPAVAGGQREDITENNVHYVHVYYFGDRPIIICVAKDDSAGTGKEYKYYKPEGLLYNPYSVTTNWEQDTNITEAPNKTNTKLENELNKLTLPLFGILLVYFCHFY